LGFQGLSAASPQLFASPFAARSSTGSIDPTTKPGRWLSHNKAAVVGEQMAKPARKAGFFVIKT
jgi:hypothetical protein